LAGSGGLSVGIVRSRTKATEISFLLYVVKKKKNEFFLQIAPSTEMDTRIPTYLPRIRTETCGFSKHKTDICNCLGEILELVLACRLIIIIIIINGYILFVDRLCGLVVRVLHYRSGGPGSIPGTTRKKVVRSGTGSTQPREYN
jgi:hypothetical protein